MLLSEALFSSEKSFLFNKYYSIMDYLDQKIYLIIYRYIVQLVFVFIYI